MASPSGFVLPFFGTQDDQIHPTIRGPAFVGVVGSDRVELSIPGRRQSGGFELIMGQRAVNDRGGPGGGKLPVGGEFGGADGYTLGAAFDPDMIWNLLPKRATDRRYRIQTCFAGNRNSANRIFSIDNLW